MTNSNLPLPLRRACEAALGAAVLDVRSVGGGDINEARRLSTGAGEYFLKLNPLPQAEAMFDTEAQGLALLQQSATLRVPAVVAAGRAGDMAYLLMEYIAPGERSDAFWEAFGAGLAELHRREQPFFGLRFDNYIGSLPQPNGRYDDFVTFYTERRLWPQLELALSTGRLGSRESGQIERLCRRLPELLPAEAPSLIHGDLWGGNFLVDDRQRAVLIDPAIAYAHRELDLAMSRLFSGFALRFYQAYHAAFPTAPGFNERLEIYQLYYLLVHVNLFGAGYTGSVRRILDKFD